MPENKAKGVAPPLRFPEFRNAGPWEVQRLGEIADCYQPETIAVSSTSEDGEYPVYGANGIIGYLDRYNHKEPEVIVGCRGQCGNVFLTPPRSWITGNSMVIHIVTESVIKKFLYYLLTASDLSYLITGSAQPQITGEIKLHKVFLPPLPEQQKIADFLSSLDDLIRAEGERLEALKEHKKGLMQRLFPREGQTTPDLRFPEFRNTGPWEAKRLGDVVAAEKSNLSMSDVRPLGSSPFPVYGADGIVGSRDSFQQKNTCISMVKDGSGVGRLMLVSGPASVLSTLIWLKPKDRDKVLTAFLFYAISSLDLMRYVIGSGIPHLYFSDISAAKISLPRLPEQQKIADFLSSLDDLIRAQEARIDALKQHKKGLMQQLFPQEVK